MLRKLLCAIILLIPALALGAQSSCTVTTTPVNFGSYDVFSNSALDTVGQVSVNCSGGASTSYSVVIQLNKGLNGSIPQRKMQRSSGNDTLSYNLYTNAGRSIIWGDGTGGSSTQTLNMNGGPASTLSIYGRVPPLQDVSIGNYTDSVTVTINF
jgi:spore coat protein U-like protein